MEYITLEQIDEYIAKKALHKKRFFGWNILKEVFQFGVVFVSVFLMSTIVVNANLFLHTLQNVLSPVRAEDVGTTLSALNAQDNADNSTDNSVQASNDQSQFLEQQIAASLDTSTVLPDHTQTMSYYLEAKTKDLSFQFNTLPPENRIIIPAIGVNAPIVDVADANQKKLKEGDFDQELYSGVVKYPSTPEPGMTGNTLIFGHTSYYRWKKNPFAEVFAKMPAIGNRRPYTGTLAWSARRI